MSQIIVAQNGHGIVLASENRAIQLDEKGNEVSLKMNRLLPLTSHCALLTAGAPEGTEMGNALKNFLLEEKLNDVQELYGAAIAFLSTEYERFMRKKCELLPIDPIHQVSFILAGKTEKDQSMPFRLYFLWTKKKLPQLDGDEISHTFSVPRRMGLEFRLNKMCKENASLKDILKSVREGMEQLKGKGEVSGPFSFATITQEGFQSLNP
jgi:20S proteasome alpha/beta subunit